jgi:CubicO group peptidase (beta-lactamase class C family)
MSRLRFCTIAATTTLGLALLSSVAAQSLQPVAIPRNSVLTSPGWSVRAFGYQDREKQITMTPDAIFRIASMTKPIISVGAMMLAEEGKLDIATPVFQYLPEFKDLQVGVEKRCKYREHVAGPETAKSSHDGAGPALPHCRPRLPPTDWRRTSSKHVS